MKNSTILFKNYQALTIRHLLSCILCLVSVFVQSQNYRISFAGAGASSIVDSVVVENLKQCKSLTLAGSDTLLLSADMGINEISNSTDNSLHIYPNPMTGYCLIDFEATAQGETTIELYDIAGKRITQMQEFLFKGQHTYSLSGTGSGIYVLVVTLHATSCQYSYSDKIVSCNAEYGLSIAELKHIEATPIISRKDAKTQSMDVMKSLKSNKSLIEMQYNAGDTLKLTGISGIYRTVFILAPVKSQTLTFDFIACTDGDNNNYAIVQIGTQTWMEENLKTTTYNDGAAIPTVTDNTAWANLSTPGYCWYNDSVKYKNIYGGLYNWYAINTGKLCPTGWHVPADSEWTLLTVYLGGENIAGGKMKEACSKHWSNPNTGATNSSGFTALPGGIRYYAGGSFNDAGSNGFWWSATGFGAPNAWAYSLSYGYPDVDMDNSFNETSGFSVRCVKDCPAINAPGSGINIPSQNQIIWNWKTVSGARGYKWNTTNNYSTATDIGINTSYTQQGLTCNTSYTLYVWAYNICGNSSVTTLTQNTTVCSFANCGNITDFDGNVYNTVVIGTQCWMQQNLKTTSYNDGSAIPLVADNNVWANNTTPAYCWYNDSIKYENIYGALYNWYAVNTGKLCPAGWHVPDTTEWTALVNYLGGTNIAGGAMKSTSSLWESPNTGATNSSGFTALPGGNRHVGSGTFGGSMGLNCYFWFDNEDNATFAWDCGLFYDDTGLSPDNHSKTYGFSVRCIKN